MNTKLLPHILVLGLLLAATTAYAQSPVSGYDFLTPEMQTLQDDDFSNPGLIAVDAGETLFSTPGRNGKSCASCHANGDGELDPKQIARYPVYSETLQRPITLRNRIVMCRNQRMDGPALEYGNEEALQLEAFVRRMAYGESVNVDTGGSMAPYYEAGKKLFHTRWGQVDIACHQCHDYHAGQTFRGQKLSQGQSNGFPVYRFTEGQVVGLQERITQCLTNLRAEPFALDSKEYTALEVYMNARGNGLRIETPGMRY